MATNSRSEQTQSFPGNRYCQDEIPETIRLSLQKWEWVTSLDFSNAYFHILIAQRSRKYLRFSHQNNLPIHLSPLVFCNGLIGIHKGGKGGRTDGSSQGYQDPPVPRRLVVASPVPRNVPTTYPDPLGPMP